MSCDRWDQLYDVGALLWRHVVRVVWCGVRDCHAAGFARNVDHDWSGGSHRRRGDVDVASATHAVCSVGAGDRGSCGNRG